MMEQKLQAVQDDETDPFRTAPPEGGIIADSPLYKAWGCRDFVIKVLPPVESDEVYEMDYTTDCEVLGIATSRALTYGSFGGSKLKKYGYDTNDTFYLSRGIHSFTQAKLDHSALVVEFKSELKERFYDDLAQTFRFDDPILSQPGLPNGHLHAAMITDFLGSDGYGGRLRADSILNLLLCDFGRTMERKPDEHKTNCLSDAAIRRVMEYVDAHIDDQISVECLAKLVNISPFHFSRLFKATTGLPPHSYVIRHRVLKGQQLLERTRMSIAEIAFTVGFSSQSHFTTAFRKTIGVSPGKFR